MVATERGSAPARGGAREDRLHLGSPRTSPPPPTRALASVPAGRPYGCFLNRCLSAAEVAFERRGYTPPAILRAVANPRGTRPPRLVRTRGRRPARRQRTTGPPPTPEGKSTSPSASSFKCHHPKPVGECDCERVLKLHLFVSARRSARRSPIGVGGENRTTPTGTSALQQQEDAFSHARRGRSAREDRPWPSLASSFTTSLSGPSGAEGAER